MGHRTGLTSIRLSSHWHFTYRSISLLRFSICIFICRYKLSQCSSHPFMDFILFLDKIMVTKNTRKHFKLFLYHVVMHNLLYWVRVIYFQDTPGHWHHFSYDSIYITCRTIINFEVWGPKRKPIANSHSNGASYHAQSSIYFLYQFMYSRFIKTNLYIEWWFVFIFLFCIFLFYKPSRKQRK